MRLRLLAILAFLVLVAAACGQKSGVHVATGGGGGGLGAGDGSGLVAGDEGVTGEDGTAGDAGDGATAGDAGGDGSGGADAGGGAGGGATGGGTGGATGGGTGGAAGGGTGGATGGAAAAGGGGKAWGDTIVVGIHAPLTGAAPLPAASFEKGKDLYSKYINDKGGIHGRKLQVEFLDDEYQPATAVSKCKQLVEQKKAFFLFGGGGTDQIQACARYAQSVGVPYLSAGVTEVGMRSLKTYFAISMSYPQQAPMLARYIKQNFAGKKVGVIYSNTKNFYDARDAFLKELPEATKYQMSRLPSQSETAQTAQKLCADRVQVAFILTAPSTYIFTAGNAKTQCGSTNPIQWTGVGVTMGLNAVAGPGCDANGAVDKGIFFSPFPAEDKIASLDPEFIAATKKYTGGSYDDIYIALWGGSKIAAEILKAAGPNLTRAGFIAAAEKQQNLSTGVYPPVSYTPTDHFGSKQVHVLQADCSIRKYRTLATFASY